MQRELVKGVEEKEIERSKCADCAAREEEQAGVEEPLRFLDRWGKPDCAEQDEGGEKKHDQGEPIRA